MYPVIVFYLVVYGVGLLITARFMFDDPLGYAYKDSTKFAIAVLWPLFLLKTLLILIYYFICLICSGLWILVSDWRQDI